MPMLAVIGSYRFVVLHFGIFRAQAVVLGHQMVSQHCQTVAGNCAKRFSLHVLQGC